MKPLFRLSMFALVLTLATPAIGAAGPKPQPGKQTSDGGFKDLVTRYYDSWNKGGADSAAPLYAKDADLVFYDISPLKYTGWGEYKEGVKKLFEEFPTLKILPHDDLKATRRGSIAWTTETFHVSGKNKAGTAVEMDGRHTLIWEKRSGKWLIVHEHFSAPLPE